MTCGAWRRKGVQSTDWNYSSSVPAVRLGEVEHSHTYCPPCGEQYKKELIDQIEQAEKGESK